MTLKEWNNLQVEMFEKFKFQDSIIIFQMASVISSFRDIELNEDIANEVLKTIEKELCRKGDL